MIKGIALLLSLLICACSTGHIIRESGRSIEDIKQAILIIAGEPRVVSENKREFTSNYFSRKKDPNFDPAKSKERLFAKFTILGDRRPYDIQVQVFIEQRTDGTYEEVGLDDVFTDQIATELKRQLTKRPGDRNVIDDFRAF